ncbi:unnamed protein product [Leptosia nina]|uniref:unspecific monooxygenase n=1 Tax=Leptosia nina TaxID=320188 RepID=A0AAV1IXJ7_9NEOP
MFTTALLVVVLIALYSYYTRKFQYWKLRGLAEEAYWRYPEEKVVGFYRGRNPQLVIRDPELAKKVLMTDFFHFYPRGMLSYTHKGEPMFRNLFFADGDVWRLLRQRLTPAFTSGKLRAMFPLIQERAKHLQTRALRLASGPSGAVLDARDLMARYTTDFIGACGFGLDAASLQDEDSEFRKLGVNIFKLGFKHIIKIFLKETFPTLLRDLKFMEHVETNIMHLMREVLKQRNYEPSNRHDFVDLLLECQRQGIIEGESLERAGERCELRMDDELLAAQLFVFFAAGFETSSSATSIALHYLAHNPRVQQKVHKEIDTILAKHDNKLTYDAVKEMSYIEWTFKEAMRLFPPLGYLTRECARKYTFEELNLTVDEGVKVFIPLQAMHNDPKHFDAPHEFRPERFDPTAPDAQRYKHVYIPFGDGPRACIGARLGLMQSVAGLAAVLAVCSVSPAPNAPPFPSLNPASNVVQTVKTGVPVVFKPRSAA